MIGTAGWTLSLRSAVAADCATIFRWANDPDTRANSFSPDAIAWDDHRRWFDEILGDPARQLHIILASGEAIGQARFEPCGEGEAEMSVSLAPEWRGRGLAAAVIRLVTAAAGAEVVHAYVKPGNETSRRAFLRAGYVELGTATRKGSPAVHFTSTRAVGR
jgi:RimJ/RimL family protein N-acetyltransferase